MRAVLLGTAMLLGVGLLLGGGCEHPGFRETDCRAVPVEGTDGAPDTRTTRTHDAAGRLLREEIEHVDPSLDDERRTRRWSDAGVLVEEVEERWADAGRVWWAAGTFDAAGRPLQRTEDRDGDAAFHEPVVTHWTWDERGNLLRKQVEGGAPAEQEAAAHTYDRDGRLLRSEIDLGADGSVDRTVEYSYGADGTVTETTRSPAGAVLHVSERSAEGLLLREESHGADGVGTRTLEYDEAGRLVRETVGTQTTRYVYDEAGRPTLEESRWEGGAFHRVERTYDEHGSLVREHTSTQGGTLSDRTWSDAYDARGRVVREEAGFPPGDVRTWRYEEDGQLVIEERDWQTGETERRCDTW